MCSSLNQSLAGGWREDHPQSSGKDQPHLNQVTEIGVEVNSPNEKQDMMEGRGQGMPRGFRILCNGSL